MVAFLTNPMELMVVGLICVLVFVAPAAIITLAVVLIAKNKSLKAAQPPARCCPHCGETILQPARFCPGCGKPLTT